MNRKIKSLEEIARVARNAGRKGMTVVLANGIFDILHVGHVRYLRAAKSLGDILVVAVNNDRSARALKGSGRPIIPLKERMEVLSAVAAVDYCVPFSGETADGLIRAMRPDIHAKGTDYTPDSVPERKTVLSYGGRIAIAGDPKRHATRDLIRRILRNSGRTP